MAPLVRSRASCVAHRVRVWVAPIIVLLVASRPAPLGAQVSHPTIPLAVATSAPRLLQFGRLTFYDAVLPPGYPTELVPSGAQVLGGSLLDVRDALSLQALSGVFAMPSGTDARVAVRAMLTTAGYAVRVGSQTARGGFVQTAGTDEPEAWCKGSSTVLAAPVDSANTSVYAITVMGTLLGEQECSPAGDADISSHGLPQEIPSLAPPSGATWEGGGQSWGGQRATTEARLRTTMSAAQVVAHYSAQLQRAGWSPTGAAAAVDGSALQRFAFQSGGVRWRATLIAMTVDDDMEVELRFIRQQP